MNAETNHLQNIEFAFIWETNGLPAMRLVARGQQVMASNAFNSFPKCQKKKFSMMVG